VCRSTTTRAGLIPGDLVFSIDDAAFHGLGLCITMARPVSQPRADDLPEDGRVCIDMNVAYGRAIARVSLQAHVVLGLLHRVLDGTYRLDEVGRLASAAAQLPRWPTNAGIGGHEEGCAWAEPATRWRAVI